MEKFNLSAKTAFVTGGCYGIGLDLKKILSEAGATVTIGARDEERLKQAAEEIQ
ncbi:MAG: SDR family NAD(P)-dependent oxidoreductase [Halieaceae bacterium]|nr:SDR family NAD(P)-dependent oxidoreductase [Halieaceae bacterium]